ncbi:MAG TPA: YcbK family protein [Candidatus Nitrosocosmicus sp.]|nr:YcbK family protein [Candidatus Nitrosocosmicus sp.]
MTKFHQSLARSYQITDTKPMRMTRRTFVKLGSMAAVAGLLPRAVFGSSKHLSVEERSLAFYNTHTGEKLKSIYWAEGNYVDGSLRQISYILRDPRSDEVHDIDTRLLDLLFSVRKEIETNEPFQVISGYRSARTNAFLRAHSTAVAENSLHLVGQASDIRLPGRETRILQKAAIALKGGGVGYYPKSDFVHLDIGRVRYW